MRVLSYPSALAEKKVKAIINRSLTFTKKDMNSVSRIIKDIKKNGDSALISYVNRFDSPELTIDALKVSEAEFKNAARNISRSYIKALNRAIRQIKDFHLQQVRKSWLSPLRPGTLLGQMINPVDAAGVYVPGGTGGKTPLVSSVLMGAIPAKIAQVPWISIATPPTKTGKIDPHLLVAAKKAGVDCVYKIGSAWAIAALCFGTESIKKVNMIVGPGNIYVTLAKKLVAGSVGIDMIAGPSEILIIADDTADPEFIAADLLSQAEHDPLASAILITPDKALADKVGKAVENQLFNLSRREIAAKSLKNYGALFVVADLEMAIELANRFAPEHLELFIKEPFDYLDQIKNAGAVFLGPYTPEAVGDYIAGPNHVLPTAGTARYSSALSVDNFIKKTSLIHYSKQAFKKEAGDMIRLAETEGLTAHANSVKIRLGTRTK